MYIYILYRYIILLLKMIHLNRSPQLRDSGDTGLVVTQSLKEGQHVWRSREAWHRLRSQGKVKTVADMSEREKRRKRAYWKKAKQNSRERKSRLENVVTPPDSPDNHPPQSSR